MTVMLPTMAFRSISAIRPAAAAAAGTVRTAPGTGQQIGQGDPGAVLETGKTVAIAVQNTADMVQIGAGGAKRRVEAARGRKQVIIVVQVEIGRISSIISRTAVRGRSGASEIRGTGAYSDMGLDLLARGLHILGEAGDLEHGLLVAGRRDYVGVGLLLNTFDGSALGAHDKAHHAVGDPDLHGGLPRGVGH